MNNFHVYEAIGRGKNSAVYKGRKKKTLEYYAVKSVDKSQRAKVLAEVKILHALEHPNVLRFYAWYETSAHLWLVLEYCVGGDLMSLLQQDSRLPEDFIHDLAFDLVKALQFLHSKEIIYCDLKPSNILMDENGRMKLCDFGLARRLSDIEKSSIATLPQSKRGTPCYMSPELFQDGGVHSYASDFWALGCVLYECYTGRPPFTGKQFTQLVKSILSDPTPPLPDNASSSFVDLISCLLVKDPGQRLHWPEICQHPFWKTKFTSVSLPPQPAFDCMLQLFVKPHLTERNGDRPSLQRTPSKGRENIAGVLKIDENSKGNKAPVTPVKNAYNGRKAHKPSGRVDDKHEDANASKGVNILRLSRIAKSNLQRETEKDNYRRPSPTTCENEAEVKIENNDMELDFSENPDDDSPDESESLPCTPVKKPQVNASENIKETEHDMYQADAQPENVNATADDLRKLELEPCLENIEVFSTPPSSYLQRKAQNVKAAYESAPDSDAPRPPNSISEVFWHSSDLSVKPVMPSRKGDKAIDGIPPLPFDAVPANDYVKLLPERLTALNSRIINSLSGGSQLSEKQNAIRYLEMLSGNVDAANMVTNGPIMLLLVKTFRLSKGSSVLRVQLASVIGLLIRRSPFIQSDLASSGIVNALSDGLRDKQDKVRRYSMAALGELLFYISTQTDQNAKDTNTLESPSKDHRSSAWQVPNSVIALVSSILRKGEDDIAQSYALRSIENVCSQGWDWTSRFATQDVIGNLCYIYKATGKQESTRLTAGSCLVRLARFSPPCIQSVFEKLSLRDAASALTKGSPREQQISLNLLIMAIISSHLFTNMGRHLLSLVEEKHLVPGLISFIEQGTEVLRGKSLILVALLCKNSRRWLPHFLGSGKLLSVVDRLLKEKDVFVQQCMESFVQLVASTVPSILETVSGDIQQQMTGVKRNAITSTPGRGIPKSNSHLFPIILHIIGSTSFKHRVITSQVLQQLANMIKLLEAPSQARDDFQITLLRVLESVTQEPSVILDDPKIFTSRFLPSLAFLYKSNKDADARFLCLKILFDVMVIVLSDVPDTSLRKEGIAKDLDSISQTYFLPLYPAFIEDEHLIPMYAQKLLIFLIEFQYIKVSDILNPKTVSQCFQFLSCDLSNANVNNVKLCFALASAPEMETKVLSDLRVVRKIGNLLEFVKAKEMEDFLEPTLDLCKAFILRGIGSNRGIAIAKEPALLGTIAFDMSTVTDQQYSIKDITDFGSNVGAFLELTGHPVVKITDLASECMILLLKAAPREATLGILTKFPKIANLLESLLHKDGALQLLRVLYSLAFSCKQYSSHGIILSIPVPAVKRIQAVVSALKGSPATDVAEAAISLDLELQRLPHGV